MKKNFSVLLTSLLLLIGCSKQEALFQTNTGETVQLSALKGKWVIIHYWAEWCDNCIKEIPALNHFSNKKTNTVFYSVNFDHLSQKDLQKTIHQLHIQFPVLTTDPNEAWQLGAISVLPTTFVIDPNGHLAKKIVGSSIDFLNQLP